MTDYDSPKEPFDLGRDPEAAAVDPDLNEDLIDSVEADRLAAERRAEATDAGEDDQLEDTMPIDPLE
jgi:hypothetical protein